MFSRFTNALYNAVDALAPPLPLQEDFVWHWKAITRFFTAKNASNTTPIEVTSIPGHLLEMLSIVEQEEKEVEVGNIGPCMEYIMQHKLLDTMCVLATSDTPPGMKRHMFTFVTRLLKIMQESLIPHVSIYVPIQNFIKLCGEIVAGPTESEEMEYLLCVCKRIFENPHLVNCFLSNPEPSSRRSSMSEASKSEAENDKEFALVLSLLKLYQSPDNEISLKAKECLKVLCSCANDIAAPVIAYSSPLSHTFCQYIVLCFKNIPKTIKLSDLENPDDDDESHGILPDKRKYLCYLQQLSFVDSVVQDAHPVISDALASCFKSEFLETCIRSCFIKTDRNEDLLFVTTLTASSLRSISSQKLKDSFGSFLLSEDEEVDYSEHRCPTLFEILLERCRDSDGNVALALSTLQLFEELILKPTEAILYNLIIKYLEGRGYYDNSAADSWLQFSDEETCSRFSDDFSPGSSPPNKVHSPPFIHRAIESFLAILPDDLKSCDSDEDSGYETYLKEAHGRFMKCLTICENFEWKDELPEKDDSHLGAEDDSSSESQPEADSARWSFDEGPFLSMIFDKLEQMLQQPYEINLQLTSILSRLALFPHPLLHEYLLNPLIPYTPDARSLFLVLFKVSEDIQGDIPNVRGFKTKIKLTRNALLSDGNEYATFEESSMLEAMIVLEEFCKELAAIAFVKYHASS
ncbi:FHF complex subunit HOOK interacting protein 2A-like [Uloborus diversus]|uniref:FHF complex subunit HOOK interacting protein 2A-like n=1 Tax=Uloborus diversus TaxID=327109 RepID=UPI002409F89C|nr:FHF complex subunit HOOK interacting protein 2A-like [Uloborus diversus]